MTEPTATPPGRRRTPAIGSLLRRGLGCVWSAFRDWQNGLWLVAIAVIVTLLAWGGVLFGHTVLVGGDLLYQFPPWQGEAAAHAPGNPVVGDPVTQFVPWLGLVRDSLLHGRLPLWNPYSLSGTPLLANDQSAPFSPFTIEAMVTANPARGLSLAMVTKVWVAGIGTALFLRQLGARGVASVAGGIAYGTSSFMVVWLAYPHSSVAALLPFGFAAVEWCVRTHRPVAVAALAAVVGLQFLAGHAETSLHMGLALAVYACARAAAQVGMRRRIVTLVLLALGAGVGCALAAVELVPFLTDLSATSLAADRIRSGSGTGHILPDEIISWLIPNGAGNPAIDGSPGRFPNYPEAAAFAGVGMLVLAPFGFALLWRHCRTAAVALAGSLLFAVGMVYGWLTPSAGRLPGLSASNNVRLIAVATFCLASLGGMGVEALMRAGRTRRLRWVGPGALCAGVACLAALGGCAVALAIRTGGVDGLLPRVGGAVGFWVLVAGLSIGVVAMCLLCGLSTARWARFGGALAASLTLAEGVLFALPYNPRTPVSEAPPPSAAMSFLQQRTDGYAISGVGLDAIPDLSDSYRIRDVRGVDVLLNPRLRTYWGTADPHYTDAFLYTVLYSPTERWLAAAGVEWFVTDAGVVLRDTTPMYKDRATTISQLPNARPFAFTVDRSSVAGVSDPQSAVRAMIPDPLGAVVVEGSAQIGDGRGATSLRAQPWMAPSPEHLEVAVDGPRDSTLVVLQSFAPGWAATVDGVDAPIRPADVLFQAVDVPAGHHVVRLTYRPSSVLWGVALSAVGIAGIVGLVASGPIRARLRRRERH